MAYERGVDDTWGTWSMTYLQAVLCTGLTLLLLRGPPLPYRAPVAVFLGIQAALGLLVGVTTQFFADEALASYRVLRKSVLALFHAGFIAKAWFAAFLLEGAHRWPAWAVVAVLAPVGLWGAITEKKQIVAGLFLAPDFVLTGVLITLGVFASRSGAAALPLWLLALSGGISIAGTIAFIVLQPLCRGKDNTTSPLPEQFNHNALFHVIWMVAFATMYWSFHVAAI